MPTGGTEPALLTRRRPADQLRLRRTTSLSRAEPGRTRMGVRLHPGDDQQILSAQHSVSRMREITFLLLYFNKAIFMPTVTKANHEIIRQYWRTVLIHFD